MEPPESRPPEPAVGDFLGEPTRELSDWKWLWDRDQAFPVTSHRGLFGKVVVLFKKLLRPFVKTPQNDLWERQRIFNLILLEYLQKIEDQRFVQRLELLEDFKGWGLEAAIAHNDALFARLDQKVDLYRRKDREVRAYIDAVFTRIDQKLDRYRREARELEGELKSTLALAEAGAAPSLAEGQRELGYVDLERHFRGSEEDIAGRVSRYSSILEDKGEVLDLGCGRGEALSVFRDHGIPIRGVDASAAMVEACREKGLVAEEADLFEALESTAEGSLGGVVSFHVIEHLAPDSLDRLVRLSWRVLAPGGVLILETPSPLSVVMSARNFWLDPTHRRPVHPESLRLACRRAGFESVERLDLSPFAPGDRLPELETADLPESLRVLADRVNRLRDELDRVLFGFQDFAIVAIKGGGVAAEGEGEDQGAGPEDRPSSSSSSSSSQAS